MSAEQGNEVAERFASFLYRIIYNNNYTSQQFQILIQKIELIKKNNDLINSYNSVLSNPNLDSFARQIYDRQIQELTSNNQFITQTITSNHELVQSLNQSVAIDKSVILQVLAKLKRGGGNSNQFIDSIEQL
jgi:hypothetical protein